ncbi:ribonuclease H-like domain-containing protein [Streptomyces longwoodensis]|uniref:ribonuclease H-like domain-containing protein n=1 Tax=Streptomyces longwoodensis TaxID=68231 RepID=UPI002259B279|nr:hypothetical protein [Streptomyces longwoodensis]MCX4998617.1 hypothetical protein [Streptomyces longwoodensis]
MQAQPQNYIRESQAGQIKVFRHDLPEQFHSSVVSAGRVAWDIETNGLDPQDSQIGTCQLYVPDVGAFIITHLANSVPSTLSRLLSDKRVLKVFHHAPFDLSFMTCAWEVQSRNVACTKIAAKIIDPSANAEQYSLKYLMAHHFNFRMDKSIRFSNWLADSLSDSQVEYAIGDVIRLLDLYDLLRSEIANLGLNDLYERAVDFLPAHVLLLLRGCPDPFKY